MAKSKFCVIIGIIGSGFAQLFGGWDAALVTLVVFMAIDYLTGVVVAGVFKKSKKTKTGTLDSKIGWEGLCRKGMILLFVLIGHRLDIALNLHVIRDAIIFGFMSNDLLSIIENAGLMGLPLPAIISKAVEMLTDTATNMGQRKE